MVATSHDDNGRKLIYKKRWWFSFKKQWLYIDTNKPAKEGFMYRGL